MLNNTNLLQTCFVEMSIQEKEKTKVQLVPDELEMFQKTTMAIFFFTHVTLTYKNESSLDDGIHLVLRMKRIITSEMMTTYLPTALLLLITYSTTFFKPCFFEAALSVNLTTMLVMTTIFISKMESLPPTSDIKMIDLWLVFCQMIPFAEVVLLTAMEYQRTVEETHSLEEPLKEEVISILGDEANEKEANFCKQINFTLLISTLKTMGELKQCSLLKDNKSFSFQRRDCCQR